MKYLCIISVPSCLELYTTDELTVLQSISKDSITFFSSSDMKTFHYLLGCHDVGIKYLLIFFNCYTLYLFIIQSFF